MCVHTLQKSGSSCNNSYSCSYCLLYFSALPTSNPAMDFIMFRNLQLGKHCFYKREDKSSGMLNKYSKKYLNMSSSLEYHIFEQSKAIQSPLLLLLFIVVSPPLCCPKKKMWTSYINTFRHWSFQVLTSNSVRWVFFLLFMVLKGQSIILRYFEIISFCTLNPCLWTPSVRNAHPRSSARLFSKLLCLSLFSISFIFNKYFTLSI